MARRPSVRYWASRNGYCCWLNGKQEVLAEGPDDFPHGPTYQAATKRFSELVCMASAHEAKDNNTCRVVCEKYLQWLHTRRRQNTFLMRKTMLARFCDTFGEVAIKDLTQARIYDWIHEQRSARPSRKKGVRKQWGEGSVRIALVSILVAFNWAAKVKLITGNPISGIEKPKNRSRGRIALIGKTPGERKANHERILAAAPRSLRPLLVALEATGARPGELAKATGADFDATLGAIIYHADDKRLAEEGEHKTGSKEKERIILLSGATLDWVRAQAEKNRGGPLFPTGKMRRKNGRPSHWCRDSLGRRLRQIRKKLGLKHFTAYSYRHTFATAWLEQGRSVDILAELMGNSPDVIRKHYSHLLGDPGNLRRQLEAFRKTLAGAEIQSASDQPLVTASTVEAEAV